MSANEKLLDVDHVTVSFHIGSFLAGGQLVAVNDVTFALYADKPEIYSIAGESGSGKTTLANVLLHDLEPTEGKVTFEGRDLSTLKSRRLDAVYGESPAGFSEPVRDLQPAAACEEYLVETAMQFGRAKNRRDAAKVADEALHQVGLSLAGKLIGYSHDCSSGAHPAALSVARALIPNPRLILADEPVSMVDASLRMAIVNLFKKLRDEQKVSVIYITHDLATAYYISDRIAIAAARRCGGVGPGGKC